ncbi:MAG: adenylate/guanylate cyclase domain-containing protein [Gammaproteobacteria bacterium]|nr:adenylate/guanylate cyclase domain-containing protein [Gammaproteobacteria bacterium]
MSKRIPILVGLALVLFAVWLQLTTLESVRLFITRLDNMAYDMQLRTKILTHHTPINSPVAIVDIDDKSLMAEGRWPWPRAKLATLLNRLQEEGVVVIAMDMMFPEKEADITDLIRQELDKRKLNTPDFTAILDKMHPELDNDAKFSVSAQQKDMVLGMTFLPRQETSGVLPAPTLVVQTAAEKELEFIKAEGYISNIPIIQQAAKNAGFINVYADPDGIIRRVPILMRYKDNLYSSLAFQAVQLFLLSKPELVTAEYKNSLRLEGVKLGDNVIPTDALAQVLIPFRGKSYTFPFISATDVLNKTIVPNSLAGKIIFLGTSASGLGDIQATAIQGAFPGVEIQATIADGILENNFSYKPAWVSGAEVFMTMILGVVLAILFPYFGPRLLSTLIIVIPLIIVFANNWLWDKTGFIISILIPILLTISLAIVNMVYGYLFETRKRERLKGMFGQYVPAKHIDEMLKNETNFALQGEDREMTVLFADIRNFTTISEPMSASELKDMLNQFFTPMTEIIFKYRGTIDKYIGDLIMAFWGAPLKDKNHAAHAIAAALDMQTAVDTLKIEFAKKGLPEIDIGIGLNSGEMSVGDMGSQFRKNYTVLGDAVNLGSRVEGLTKFYGVKIMVTESTQHEQTKFLFRKLDRVRVKGKKNGITIYEVICRKAEATEELLNQISQSNQAIECYFNKEWEEAENLFSKLHKSYPGVKLYPLYLKRITEFKQTPPPQDWDGVYVHATK